MRRLLNIFGATALIFLSSGTYGWSKVRVCNDSDRNFMITIRAGKNIGTWKSSNRTAGYVEPSSCRVFLERNRSQFYSFRIDDPLFDDVEGVVDTDGID